MQERLLSRIRDLLEADERIDAVWVGGSVGRDEQDVLSDIDLAIVAAEGAEQGLVEERFVLARDAGPLVLTLDSPQNAHERGSQVNALYDTHPLPVYVDWNVFPRRPDRPTDVITLFERRPFEAGTTYETTLATMPRGRGLEKTPAHMDHFCVAMLPIIAKLAVRGWPDAVERMYDVIGEPQLEDRTLDAVIDSLRSILDRHAESEEPSAVGCIRRYLDSVSAVASEA